MMLHSGWKWFKKVSFWTIFSAKYQFLIFGAKIKKVRICWFLARKFKLDIFLGFFKQCDVASLSLHAHAKIFIFKLLWDSLEFRTFKRKTKSVWKSHLNFLVKKSLPLILAGKFKTLGCKPKDAVAGKNVGEGKKTINKESAPKYVRSITGHDGGRSELKSLGFRVQESSKETREEACASTWI